MTDININERRFRFIESGFNKRYPLSEHEKMELSVDFDIDVKGYYALICVSKKEFDILNILNGD